MNYHRSNNFRNRAYYREFVSAGSASIFLDWPILSTVPFDEENRLLRTNTKLHHQIDLVLFISVWGILGLNVLRFQSVVKRVRVAIHPKSDGVLAPSLIKFRLFMFYEFDKHC